MVHGVSATVSGLVLVPGAAAMFAGSLVSGWLVSRTGRYRIYPVVGSLLAAAGMAVLGAVPAGASVWWFGVGVFVLQLGVGMFLQLSVLIIQNALPARMLGTATSTNNFFREIGVSIGNTVVGVLFTGRLTVSLLGMGMSEDAAASITPAVLRDLDGTTRAAVVGTLFGDNDPAVIHNHRPGIHAEKLLDAALFGKIPDGMTAQHQAEAEAVTQRICAAVEGLKTTLSFGQTGITALQTDYGGEN